MQRILIALIAIILVAGIYLFLQPVETDSNEVAQAPVTLAPETVSEAVREQAEAHIKDLTQSSQETVIDISTADNFVTGEQLLSMPTMAPEQAEIISISAIDSSDPTQTNGGVPETAESGIPVEVSVTPGDGGSLLITQKQVREGDLVITKGIAPMVTFAPTGASSAGTADSQDDNIRNNSGVSLQPGQRLRLQELLSDPDLAKGTLFYIHAVTPGDEQGLWGILQHGIIETFAKGIKLSESGRTLSVAIPEMADETLENRRSSFLGNFLYNKVQDTYVYNYYQGMLGQDPNLIKPGQQLIIVSYSEEELVSIYNHFVNQSI